MKLLGSYPMPLQISLESLTVSEKIQLLERVWDDLCHQPVPMDAPAWHEEVLAERRKRLADGRATVESWDDAS